MDLTVLSLPLVSLAFWKSAAQLQLPLLAVILSNLCMKSCTVLGVRPCLDLLGLLQLHFRIYLCDDCLGWD